jgi:hypothetical protein
MERVDVEPSGFAAALAAIALTACLSRRPRQPPTGSFVPISSYDDDPFPADSVVERMGRSLFAVAEDGQRLLSTSRRHRGGVRRLSGKSDDQ